MYASTAAKLSDDEKQSGLGAAKLLPGTPTALPDVCIRCMMRHYHEVNE